MARRTTKGFRCCAALLCVLTLLLGGCGETAPEIAAATPEPLPAPEGLRVAVASDLHLDPDNTNKSGELSGVVYNLELVEALLWDARQQGAEILLLTGDLVNGGRDYRHAALTERLRQAEAEGLQIYVLPGNHDLSPVCQTDFAELYRDFGYDEADSRDPASLSYCVIRDDLMILMLDTAGYPAAAVDLPGVTAHSTGEAVFDGAYLTEETLRWAEVRLRQAREQGLHVLCAGHYNLLPEITRQPDSGYYLENGDRLAKLLRDYGVPLYLSGHMHLRAVYQDEGLTELLTEYLLSYPTGYSVLDLTDSGLCCTPRRVNVDAWAAASGQTDPVLLDFSAWQQEELYRYSQTNVDYMARRNPLSKRKARQAAAFFYATMDAYWRGTLSEERQALEAMPGYEPFFRCAEGYSYGWWLKDLIETASPLLRGFSLDW